jgi:Dolichyl-phosphate-mannose-protein mannosyltransferase
VPRRFLYAVVALAAVVGLAMRVAVWRSDLGVLDGDEAVWGLMAKHVLDGQFAAFYWGQAYGGTIEVFLTAPVVAVAGLSTVAIRVVPLALTAVAAVLVWRIGLRLFDPQRALIAAALFWVWMPFLVWKSIRAHGFYGSGLVLSALVLLLVLRLEERPGRWDALALGLVLGLSFWQTQQVGAVALPALVWLAWRSPPARRLWWVVAAGAVVGALPWLVSNLRNDWWSFDAPPGGATPVTRLRGLLFGALPMMLGLRVPFQDNWVFGTALSALILLSLLVGGLALAWRVRRRRAGVLVAVMAGFPLVYAASTATWLSDEPRYVVVLAPVLALLAAYPLSAPVVAAAATAAAALLSVVVLWQMGGSEYDRRADGAFVPDDFAPLVATLDRLGADRVFADYWVAYRLSFETDERIVAAESNQEQFFRRGRVVYAAPSEGIRYVPYERQVLASPMPGHVVVAGTRNAAVTGRRLRAAGYRPVRVDGFVVYAPSRRSAPKRTTSSASRTPFRAATIHVASPTVTTLP